MGNKATYLAVVILVVLLLLGVVVALAVLYFGCKTEAKAHKSDELLQQLPLDHDAASRNVEGSTSGAAFLREGWSPGLAPCHDFYAYACRNWSLSHPLPPGRRQYSTMSRLRDRVAGQLFSALDELRAEETAAGNASTTSALLRVFDSCLARDAQWQGERRFWQNPLVALLDNSRIGMWPLMSYYWRPKDAHLNIASLTGLLEGTYGVSSFLRARIQTDFEDPSRRTLYIEPGPLTLGSVQFYINASVATSYLRQYRQMLAAVASEFASDLGGTLPITASADIVDIVSLEISLATFLNASRVNSTRFTLVQLRAKYPGFHWDDYLTGLLPPEVYGRLSSVVLVSPEWVGLLSSFVHQASPKAVYNYLIWRLIHERLWALTPRFRELHQSFKELLDVRQPLSPHRFQCLDYVKGVLGQDIGRLYVDRVYDKRITPHVEALAADVIAAYARMQKRLKSAAWLDPATRAGALAKLAAVEVQVAFPPQLLNDSWLAARTANLSLRDPHSFFAVFNDVARWRAQDAAYSLLRRSKRGEWFGASPAVMNAWYSPTRNGLALPAAMLQSPLFRADYPPSLRFGLLGSIIGHELAHGFGLVGASFGGNGSLSSWLDPASRSALTERRSCLAERLSGFCYPSLGLCVDGARVVGEAAADATGLAMAGDAFRAAAAPTTELLGSLSASQTFFLAYARMWCGEAEEAALRESLRKDAHAPAQVRVTATLSASAAFAAAWHCGPSDPMVADTRCDSQKT